MSLPSVSPIDAGAEHVDAFERLRVIESFDDITIPGATG